MSAQAAVAELAEGVLSREPVVVARAISAVEDRREVAVPRAVELLRVLGERGRAASCHRIGITGPPGVGKSSLISALVARVRASGKTVAVLAVDPSSPRSGGALLGDRARISIDPDDTGAFVRSMASGGQLGGLARAAGAAVDVLSAAYDVVLIETTGVGQSETDVEHVADTVLLVVQPASGDVLQFIKAGILEIPDLLTVNKADLGAVAERAGAELRAALRIALDAGRQGDVPEVLLTSTSDGRGLDELVRALGAHHARLTEAGVLATRRIEKSAQWALRLYVHRYGEAGLEAAGGKAALGRRFAEWIASGATAVEAVSRAAAGA